ncbi:PD-(D/E)XK nuclease family protein [Bacteroides sp.]|uniref:PDDEXK-like family protein n=1 Tax=Bacteroides sp. TaxID=29523 RepID=UPI002589DBBA|nr:PD-(D/E)XK nuclease family protein [Bacteroides sp.]
MDTEYKNLVTGICEDHKLFEQEKFNVFTAMHHKTDERRLHSRFISFLLNPNASHKKGATFLELFLSTIELKPFDTHSITVYPTEEEKKEKENIDILIINKSSNSEIIIENKIFASDSNKKEEEKVTPQLMVYYKSRLKKNPDRNIYLVYLTLDGKDPSFKKNFTVSCLNISYIEHIPKWLKLCLNEDLTSELRLTIQQYLTLIYSITNNYKLALALKNTIKLENRDIAHRFWCQDSKSMPAKEKLVLTQFKHIKWHTVHEFYTLLTEKLEKEFDPFVEGLTEKEITAKAHNNSIRGLRIRFTLYNKVFYISNDSQGFTMGIHHENEKNKHRDFSFNKKDKMILSDFSNLSTFSLIDSTETSRIVDMMINEMRLFVEENK